MNCLCIKCTWVKDFIGFKHHSGRESQGLFLSSLEKMKLLHSLSMVGLSVLSVRAQSELYGQCELRVIALQLTPKLIVLLKAEVLYGRKLFQIITPQF